LDLEHPDFSREGRRFKSYLIIIGRGAFNIIGLDFKV
jgi:hypothetical protein